MQQPLLCPQSLESGTGGHSLVGWVVIAATGMARPLGNTPKARCDVPDQASTELPSLLQEACVAFL